MSDGRSRREAMIADAKRVQRYWPSQPADDPRPRIFMLGTPSREESLEDHERRHGEPLDPAWEAKATEIAPGVRVLVLSTSSHPFGARVAVWHDPKGSDDA